MSTLLQDEDIDEEEKLLFEEMQSKFEERPDLFKLGRNLEDNRQQSDIIIGLHKCLRHSFFEIIGDNQSGKPFMD